MRLAIIGAGPSGFFVAGELLKRDPACEVHLYEKRFAPYGLVRYGVAPDHQATRRAIKLFDQIAENPRFHFYGGVEIGAAVSLDQLYRTHHVVVICTGAERANRPKIPGSNLPGVADAIDFSRWTNGELEAFSADWLHQVKTAVVVGNGNVALDVTRILAKPAAEWMATDICPAAMEALIHHRIRHIMVIGRRGADQTSFNQAELEEVVSLPDWTIRSSEPLPFEIKIDRPAASRVIDFLFCLHPVSISGKDRVDGMRLHNHQTGATVEIPAELVIFATGHRGIPLEHLPFDDAKGVIPNDKGAVSGRSGYYVCGWIKRGAKGLIGQNRKDAIETVVKILDERERLVARPIEANDWFVQLSTEDKRPFSWSDWREINLREIQRGAAVGRPRLNYTPAESGSVLKT